LQIRNGVSADAQLVGRYCGSTAPAPIQSTGSSLWLKFTTDASVSYHGFRATYETSNIGTGGGGAGTAGQKIICRYGSFSVSKHI